jgi:hypothetical protein
MDRLISTIVLNLSDVDLVIVLVRSDPFDPGDRPFEIDCHDKAVVITLDIENHSF